MTKDTSSICTQVTITLIVVSRHFLSKTPDRPLRLDVLIAQVIPLNIQDIPDGLVRHVSVHV